MWDEGYDPDKNYIRFNKVTYDDGIYVCKEPCRGILPTDTSKWILVLKSYNLKGDFLYTDFYKLNDIVHFGVEKALYQCIKPTTPGISPYNEEYWIKRIDISDLMVQVTDYVGDVTSLYTAYDNGITVNHNLNGYVQCLAVVSGAGYGNAGLS